MKKRTPQEIADFFGCWVAMDRYCGWYGYKGKPHRGSIGWDGNGCTQLGLCDIDYSGDWKDSLHSPAVAFNVGDWVMFKGRVVFKIDGIVDDILQGNCGDAYDKEFCLHLTEKDKKEIFG